MNATVAAAPPLETGQRMDRATFHARYQETPEDFKAELIDGAVFVACPISLYHASPCDELFFLLKSYTTATRFTKSGANLTCFVDDKTEVQPDAVLWVEPNHGGRCRIEAGYILGLPELVVEVAYTTVERDLKTKRRLYEAHGVLEYIVYRADVEELIWFRREGESFVRHSAGADDIFRSVAFPGLQFKAEDLISGNTAGLLATLQLGLASQAHADFVASLAARRSS